MYSQADKTTLTLFEKDNVNIPEESSPTFIGGDCNCLINKDIYKQAGLEELSLRSPARASWFVMRDLKRSNAKVPAYKLLMSRSFEVFTPMKWQLTIKQGKRIQEKVPYMQDLLFVHARKEDLDDIVNKTPTLQYRYIRGAYCKLMTVSEKEMERFVRAVETDPAHRYYLPEELTAAMYGSRIRIAGGPLDGYEGILLTTRGSRVKRLLVELPSLLSVAVEVNPEYIQLL